MRDNKGFTLVELIVTLAITAIVLAIAGGILLTSFQLFSANSSANEAKLIGDTVSRYVSDQLTYASDLQLIDQSDTATTAQYSNRIQIISGRLHVQTASQSDYNYYGDAFYLGTTVQMSVKTVDHNTISLKIDVLKKGAVIYQTQSVINLLNIQLKNGSISGITGSELTNPDLVYSAVSSK